MAKLSRRKFRVVIKVGSQLISEGGPLLIRDWMRQVAVLRKKNIQVIWVTSGAIATAVERTQFKASAKRGRSIPEKQSLSAIGQPLIMSLYNQGLFEVGLMGAQILLCADDLRNPERRKNFMQATEKLLEWDAIPVLNENDAVATDEIRFGDNDSLSAQVALCLKADRLILLTNVAGLFDSDPSKSSNAKKISTINKVPASLKKMLSIGQTSLSGTGGMLSKVLAAEAILKKGAVTSDAWIVPGDEPRVLQRVIANENIGTRFLRK